MTSRILINSDQKVAVSCSKCGKSAEKDIARFKKHHTEVKLRYTCRCGNSFPIVLERRSFFRKKVKFYGSIAYRGGNVPIRIVDISRAGLKIKLLQHIEKKIGDIISIEFVLDDPQKTRVSQEVRILNLIAPDCLGAEFLVSEHYDALGKYFLFYF